MILRKIILMLICFVVDVHFFSFELFDKEKCQKNSIYYLFCNIIEVVILKSINFFNKKKAKLK